MGGEVFLRQFLCIALAFLEFTLQNRLALLTQRDLPSASQVLGRKARSTAADSMPFIPLHLTACPLLGDLPQITSGSSHALRYTNKPLGLATHIYSYRTTVKVFNSLGKTTGNFPGQFPGHLYSFFLCGKLGQNVLCV